MSTETGSAWNVESVGQLGEAKEFEVTKERAIAYAQATNDEHPQHLSGELAPPVFAIVPVFEQMMPSIAGVVPNEYLMRVVHGEQDFVFHQPIVPGTTLVSRGGVVGVHGRSSGVAVVIKAVSETQSGDPVVEQYMTAFFRGAQFDGSVGEPVTEHSFVDGVREGEPIGSVMQSYDADQTQRYSKASGDPMPIHLDDAFAKSVGLPGIIVHGLCTMAFTSRAVIATACPDDPARLKRLAVRFASIVQPHEQVTTTLWDAGSTDAGLRRVAFETTTDAGAVAIKDGLAEVQG